MKLKICAAAAAVGLGMATFGFCLALIISSAAPVAPAIVGTAGGVIATLAARWWHGAVARSVEVDLEEAYADRWERERAAAPRRQAARHALPKDADEVRDRLAQALADVAEAARAASDLVNEALRPVVETANAAIRIFPDLETKLGDVGEHIEKITTEREELRRRAMLGDAAAAILRGDAPALEKLTADQRQEADPPPLFLQPRRRVKERDELEDEVARLIPARTI